MPHHKKSEEFPLNGQQGSRLSYGVAFGVRDSEREAIEVDPLGRTTWAGFLIGS